MDETLIERSLKEIIADETLNYANVLDFLDTRMKKYIDSNKGNLDYVKRYLIAYVVTNTYDEESRTIKPVTIEKIIKDFESLNSDNIEKIVGLPSNDPEIDAYAQIREEIMKPPNSIYPILGRIKTRMGFIGFNRAKQYTVTYFLKKERIDEFEKRFESMEPEYRSLKKVLLNLLKR